MTEYFGSDGLEARSLVVEDDIDSNRIDTSSNNQRSQQYDAYFEPQPQQQQQQPYQDLEQQQQQQQQPEGQNFFSSFEDFWPLELFGEGSSRHVFIILSINQSIIFLDWWPIRLR